MQVRVQNTGQSTWRAGDTFVTYRRYIGTTDLGFGPRTYVMSNVAPGQWTTLKATIQPMGGGAYNLDWDFGSGSSGGCCWSISDANPVMRLSTPTTLKPFGVPSLGDGAVVKTRAPALGSGAVDPDNYPGPLTDDFEIWDAPTGGSIVATSGWVSQTTWTPARSALRWGKTYYWRVGVDDGTPGSAHTVWSDDPTDGYGRRFAITPVLPPVGASDLEPNDDGVSLATGAYVSSTVDATVASPGPQLQMARTYMVRNNGDTFFQHAFGAGWWSLLDAKIEWGGYSGDTEGVFTAPDGSATRFAQSNDGSFAAEEGSKGRRSPARPTAPPRSKTAHRRSCSIRRSDDVGDRRSRTHADAWRAQRTDAGADGPDDRPDAHRHMGHGALSTSVATVSLPTCGPPDVELLVHPPTVGRGAADARPRV